MPIKPSNFRPATIFSEEKKIEGVMSKIDDYSASKINKKAELDSTEKTAFKKNNSKTLAKNFAKTKLNKQKQASTPPDEQLDYLTHDVEPQKTGSARYLDPNKIKETGNGSDNLTNSPLSPELERIVFDVRNRLLESKKS